MKVLDTRAVDIAEIQKTLRRPEIDEVTLEPQVAARLQEIFGRPLSAAEAVAEIVQDVGTRGDSAVFDYTWRIDAVKLQPETLFVSEEEMAKAQREADPAVVADIRAAAEQI
ncbi:MAG: histidinol dehydrogenase, partial [Limnochordia bacterium]